MKPNRIIPEFDALDRQILELLLENCKQPLTAIGDEVGLSAPSVVERIHKLEEAGVITGYVALLDASLLGKDVGAFIGVSTDQPRTIGSLERQLCEVADVLECHHVTGAHTLIVKVKTRSTESLEEVIQAIRSLDGVTRTETSVVLSTYVENPNVSLNTCVEFDSRTTRRSAKNRKSAAK